MTAKSANGKMRKSTVRGRTPLAGRPVLASDVISLKARLAARQQLTLSPESVNVHCIAKDGIFDWDFQPIYNAHSHLRTLLLQLIKGFHIHYGKGTLKKGSLDEGSRAIEKFIDFLVSPTTVLPQKVQCISDINRQVALSYRSWLVAMYPGRTSNRKDYGGIRTMVMAIQEKHETYPEIGPAFDWPEGPKKSHQPAESYSDEVWNALVFASLKDIKCTMRLMGSYQSLVETEDAILPPQLTLENLMHDLVAYELVYQPRGRDGQERVVEDKKCEFEMKIIRQRVAVKAYRKESGLTLQEFIDLYRRDGKALAAKGRPVDPHSMSPQSGWRFDGCDRDKTNRMLIAHCGRTLSQWPLYCPWREMRAIYNMRDLPREKIGNQFETRIIVYTSQIYFGDEANPLELGLSAYAAYQFFTGHSLYPFLLFVQIVTGWNLNVIGRITAKLDEHVSLPLIDDGDTIMLYSVKTKSAKDQSAGNVIFHASSRRKRFSAYNVLRFIAEQIARISDSPYYRPESIWQYFNVLADPDSKTKPKISPMDVLVSDDLAAKSNYQAYCAAFCKRHGIVTNPDLKKGQSVDSKRIRTTWETKQSQLGRLLEQLSYQMGHDDFDTTASSYHSDSGSNTVDNKSLRQLMNRHVDDFTNYGPRLVGDTTLQDLRKALESINASRRLSPSQKKAADKAGLQNEEEIVHLLSPGGQTFIVACKNSMKPTWPDADQYVQPGSRCRFFNKCCLCKQGLIFKEALPYVARRSMDLEDLRAKTHPIEWMRDYSKEHEGWNEVLRRWGNQSEIDEAAGVAERKEVILPLTMRGA